MGIGDTDPQAGALQPEFGTPEPSRSPEIWRRPLAMVLDGLILWGVGFPLGLLLFHPLAHLGPWARAIGFLIALLYFGILNSRIGRGQSIGKRALRIQVVQSDGSELSPSKSILRFAVIGAPYFANGLMLPLSRTPIAVTTALSILIFGVGGAAIYLFLFNRDTRQSLHDLAVGSFVVRTRPGRIPVTRLWKGHLVILGTSLCVLTLAMVYIGRIATERFRLDDLMRVLKAVESSRGVHSTSVFSGMTWGSGGGGEYFKVTANLKQEPASAETFTDGIAGIVLETFPEVMSKGQLEIDLVYGFDIGIARAARTAGTVRSPREWAERAPH